MVTDEVPLVDQHCHGVLTADLEPPGFAGWLTEAPAIVAGRDPFGSLLGLAVRRWCAPVLDLPAHASPGEYLRRRAWLGWRESTRRLLHAAGVAGWLVDTGFTPPQPLTGPDELAELAGGTAALVLRIEQVAETVAAQAESASALLDDVRTRLREAAGGAVALKTVVAYRCGLALPARRPTDAEARVAAERWLRSGLARLTEPVLLAWLVHEAAGLGASLGLPLQVHTGFGDPDLRLPTADPALLHDFLQSTVDSGVSVVLLHCWPHHRQAAYLAHVFGHVFVDIGLMLPFVGVRATEVLAETLELAPFDAVLYSSDGRALPELHYLGAALWREHLGRLLDRWIADDVMTATDAERLAHGIGAGNALRIHPRFAG